MNRWIAVLAAGTVLAGSAAITAHAQTPIAKSPAAKAVIGAFGFDTTGMDRNVKPGDDFYQYANGTWAKSTSIPSDKSNYGAFHVLQDISQQRVRDILDAAKNDPASNIGTAYASFLDEAAVEAKGLKPIQAWLGEIRALSSRDGYATLSAHAAAASDRMTATARPTSSASGKPGSAFPTATCICSTSRALCRSAPLISTI